MLHSWNQSATGGNPVRDSIGKPVARSEERHRETIPTPRFAREPSTMNSFFPAVGTYPQNCVADEQTLQISELQFDKFSTLSTFSCWKIRFKTQVSLLVLVSPSEAMFWIERSGDGRFGGRFLIIALNSRLYSFPEFWDAGCEDCVCSEQDHTEFLLQEKGQSGGTESSERRSVPSRKTDRLHDVRQLLGYWRSWYRSWLRWSIHNHSSQWWCSGVRYEVGWNSLVYDRDPTWWRPGKFVQIENTWVWSTQNRIGIVWHGNSSEDIDARLSKIENDGEEKHRSETRCETVTPEMRELKQEPVVTNRRGQRGVERGQGKCYRSKTKGRCSRGDTCSFRHDEDKRAKPTPKTAPPSEPPTQRGRSASRK